MFEDIKKKENEVKAAFDIDWFETPIHTITQEYNNDLLVGWYEVGDYQQTAPKKQFFI